MRVTGINDNHSWNTYHVGTDPYPPPSTFPGSNLTASTSNVSFISHMQMIGLSNLSIHVNFDVYELCLFTFFEGSKTMGCCCAKLEDDVNLRFNENQIIAKEMFWANLQYQRSTGCCQVQGNGALVLTSDVLWFKLLCCSKEIEMPLGNMRSVEVGPFRAPRHRGNYQVLIIDYVDPISGIEDQVMFALRDPHHWKRLIDEAVHKTTRF